MQQNIITQVTVDNGANLTSASMSATDFFNSTKSGMNNPTSVGIGSGDDLSFSYNIPNTTLYCECSTEGSFGFVDKSLTSKDSGYSYSRMYYTTREPDWQVIARLDQDLYTNDIQLCYDDSKFLIMANVSSYSNRGLVYIVSFFINRSDMTSSDIYVSSNAVSNINFLLGYKNYNRSNKNWSPQIISSSVLQNDNKLLHFDTPKTTTIISQYSYYSPNLITKNKSIVPQKISKYDNYYYTFNPYNVKSKYFANIFIEGASNDQLVYIQSVYDKVIQNIPTNKVTQIYLPNNNDMYLKSSNSNYFLNFNAKTRMMRGYLSGNISIDSSCYANKGFDPSKMYIKCSRQSDGLVIGTYSITNNTYMIPNLNILQGYDLTLVDGSGILENQVLSNRMPIPYSDTPYKLPTILDSYILTDTNTYIIATDYDKTTLQNVSIDEIRLYYSNDVFTEADTSTLPYLSLDGSTITLNSTSNIIYNYYMFKFINAYQSNYSQILNTEKDKQLKISVGK